MNHYIDKDALVAEIESLLDKGRYHEEYDCAYRDGNNGALYALKGKLDTLEVKEVNLEKEIEVWKHNYKVDDNRHTSICAADIEWLAEHFFELGLSASNPIAEENLESFVRQVIDLDIEAGEHYNNIIKEERKENGGSDLMINLLSGTIDAKELGIQYVLDKLKAQKGK